LPEGDRESIPKYSKTLILRTQIWCLSQIYTFLAWAWPNAHNSNVKFQTTLSFPNFTSSMNLHLISLVVIMKIWPALSFAVQLSAFLSEGNAHPPLRAVANGRLRRILPTSWYIAACDSCVTWNFIKIKIYRHEGTFLPPLSTQLTALILLHLRITAHWHSLLRLPEPVVNTAVKYREETECSPVRTAQQAAEMTAIFTTGGTGICTCHRVQASRWQWCFHRWHPPQGEGLAYRHPSGNSQHFCFQWKD
jgi:hypothetical protein